MSRTGLLCIDLAKAFDVVDRDKLLHKVESTNLHSNLKRWLLCYMRDRRMRVRYQGCLSKWRKTKLGMPQGAVSSPPLFNFFVKDLRVESGDVNESFADDFHTAAVSKKIDAIVAVLNSAAEELDRWAKDNGMGISAQKSTVTLFTPWTKQVNERLDVKIGDEVIPTDKNVKLLGVVLDPTFSFSSHIASLVRKAVPKVNIIRALSNTDWGKDTECLLMTFKMFVRPLFNYAAPIIYPNLSNTSILKLQRIQNCALRLALGCHTSASFEHVHNEAMELPVGEHMRLLSSQFLARALQEGHPSHQHVLLERGRRPMKETLRSKCLEVVQPYLNADGKVDAGDFPRVKQAIHTDIVAQAIDKLGSSRVLNRRPPPVDKSEASLPRLVRATLSQLRSGFCSKLKSFKHFIDRAQDDVCPDCGNQPHTTSHLFDCHAHPTRLTTESLWTDPWAAARFISTHSSFQFLPDVGLPPPPRRRGRRRPPPDPDPPPPSPPPLFTPLSPPPSPFLFTPPLSPPLATFPRSLMSLTFPSLSSTSSSLSLFSPLRSPASQILRNAESDVGVDEVFIP